MNNLNKNPVAHRRWARGAQRFSRSYMKQAEFRSRQMWLDFKDSAGTALEAITDTVEASRAWFKKWQKQFQMKKTEPSGPVQISFDFLSWLNMPVGVST